MPRFRFRKGHRGSGSPAGGTRGDEGSRARVLMTSGSPRLLSVWAGTLGNTTGINNHMDFKDPTQGAGCAQSSGGGHTGITDTQTYAVLPIALYGVSWMWGPRGCGACVLASPSPTALHLCPPAPCCRGQGSWLRGRAEPSASCPPRGAVAPALRSSRPSFSAIFRKGGLRAGSASQQLPMRVCTGPGQPSGGSMR